MGHLGNGLNVGHIVPRVANALNVHGLGLVVNGGGNVLGLVAVDKLGRDAQAREHDLELVVGAPVEVRRRDNVVASVGERRNGDELSALARCRREGRDTTLESRHALLEDVDGGVHDAAVDVTKLLEAKEPRAVGRVIEGVALPDTLALEVMADGQANGSGHTYSGRIDGDGARLGRGIGLCTMQTMSASSSSQGHSRLSTPNSTAIRAQNLPRVQLQRLKVLAEVRHGGGVCTPSKFMLPVTQRSKSYSHEKKKTKQRRRQAEFFRGRNQVLVINPSSQWRYSLSSLPPPFHLDTPKLSPFARGSRAKRQPNLRPRRLTARPHREKAVGWPRIPRPAGESTPSRHRGVPAVVH